MPDAVRGVILDLDGLILDTEVLCCKVAEMVVGKYGKRLTESARKNALGKRPYDCWEGLCKDLEIDENPQKLLDESEVILIALMPGSKILPGALRLVRYLSDAHVPYAVATSTPRATFNRKMSEKDELRSLLEVVVCGDEVSRGKPHPDVFLAASTALGLPPDQCLVFEDAESGVTAALAAGMRVVMVPSAHNSHATTVDSGVNGKESLIFETIREEQGGEREKKDEKESVTPMKLEGGVVCSELVSNKKKVKIIASLLDFKPSDYGLPPFQDEVNS
mmetsp:Transcript_28997/g.53290  ORF Transcript_28997/g.53290 Transcript_28997/m.53290 type:complete len:277 (-) Transcript_28997:167-997(-)|eukprot:CAMPEP_0175046612 /NCGR_PEP_ID=MMETSP0052_2-20121109/5128_1 /TAXON_ID=51329 ORGANISM="Polytomella parva, Strain SAG 63-3" /NCGR_SAMPLE_ID=MMETSP0052_2 /ASSEMBLY_ACC=CAM_ASM_000194 /LENGTH=276 /DNA_ID=CAMNT_0016310379 /DNA_START=53 /DNA_END=883 /DNA_ORIENTATION=-